jgi:hypothetical protein
MGLATIPHKIWEELAKLPEDYRPLSLIISCQKKTPIYSKEKMQKSPYFQGEKSHMLSYLGNGFL